MQTEEVRSLVPLASGFMFPEGGRWWGGKWWLSDFHAHRVCSISTEGDVETVAELEDRPSGLGFLPDGTLVVISMTKRQLRRVVAGGTELYADLSPYCDGFLNDMVVDGTGRAYVGARNRAGGAKAPLDALLIVDPDGSVRVGATGMQSPNGSVVTPDGATLIVAESSQARLTAFTIDPDGSLRDRRLFAAVPELHPDGICLDVEGAIWFGSPMTEEFVRVREGGAVVARIATPGTWAVCCALGGADRRTLLGLTAHNSIANMRRLGLYEVTIDETSEARGEVGITTVAVPGAGWP